MSNFVKFGIEEFSLCFYVIGSREFVIVVDSKYWVTFVWEIMSLLRVIGGEGKA
jgi:hypothetical protein